MFKKNIISWYTDNRRNLPWRRTADPYRIAVSEIMLQQTQVSRVQPKYLEFLRRFPTVKALAEAPLSDVLRAWQGLGYNRRAQNLHKLAKIVASKHGGKFPRTQRELAELPGVGWNTAGAVCAYAYNIPAAYIETNIRRVFIHEFFPGRRLVRDEQIIPLVQMAADAKNPRVWYSALMDYGTYLAKQVPNPNRRSRHYAKQSKFENSNRQLRGRLLKQILTRRKLLKVEISGRFRGKVVQARRILKQLASEGLVRETAAAYVTA